MTPQYTSESCGEAGDSEAPVVGRGSNPPPDIPTALAAAALIVATWGPYTVFLLHS